jgi:ferredoxin
VLVTPSLHSEIRKYGRFDAGKCLNCGTCTITCDLSGDSASFPRRPIQFALIGLKELVHGSLEPWLCHDCGDCSTKCPQQAEPRESLGTLRRYLIAQYDWTGLSAKIMRSRAWAVGSILFTGVLVLLLAVLYHSYIVGLSLRELSSTPMKLDHMFGTITWFTLVVILLPFLILLSHGYRMYRFTMSGAGGASIPLSLFLSEAKTFFMPLFAQTGMKKCPGPERRTRWWKHLLLASGCVLMLAILVFALRWFQTDNIYPITHPQRWLGYVATALLLFGSGDILLGRIRKKGELHKRSDAGDYTFPALLFLTAASGIAVHILRYLGFEMATHFSYALHLAISVPMLVVEMPFGRWSHMIYRPLALYFQSVKDKASALESRKEDLEAA